MKAVSLLVVVLIVAGCARPCPLVISHRALACADDIKLVCHIIVSKRPRETEIVHAYKKRTAGGEHMTVYTRGVFFEFERMGAGKWQLKTEGNWAP